MSELENELSKAVTEAVTAEVKHLRTAPPQSVSQQWDRIVGIQQQLRDRVRRERMMINAEFERLVVETNQDFDRRVDTAMSQLETDRRDALATLAAQTAGRLRELDLLAKRME